MLTEHRCPQCHKRLGQSAIAVHAPRYVTTLDGVELWADQKIGAKSHTCIAKTRLVLLSPRLGHSHQ